MQTLLFILWILFISGALMTTVMICKTNYDTKKIQCSFSVVSNIQYIGYCNYDNKECD